MIFATRKNNSIARAALALALAALLALGAVPAEALAAPIAEADASAEVSSGPEAAPAAAEGNNGNDATTGAGAQSNTSALPLYALRSELTGTMEESVELLVEYLDADRTQAEVTYHKEGVAGPDANVIFLVDASGYGSAARTQWLNVMRDQGLYYLFDYGADTRVRIISYQTDVFHDTGLQGGGWDERRRLMDTGNLTLGTGVPDEHLALRLAKSAVEEAMAAHPDRPVALVWVLGDRMSPITDRTQLEQQLSELSGLIDGGSGNAFITWQLAGSPDELLARYTTEYPPDPHDPTSTHTAAFAEEAPAAFRAGLRDDIEQIAHDHYHNVTAVIPLSPGQTLVQGIASAEAVSESPFVSMEIELLGADGSPVGAGALGQAVRVTMNHVCRQADVDFVLRLQLDPAMFEAQEVIGAMTVESPADHSNGGLHTGLFDQYLPTGGGRLLLPGVMLSREPAVVVFQDNSGNEVHREERIPGALVAVPSADDFSLVAPVGSTFGGWMGSDGTRYGVGGYLTVPEGGLTLRASYGSAYAELDLGDITPFEAGNLLAPASVASVNLSGVQLSSGKVVLAADIVDVVVEEAVVSYALDPTDADPRRVSLNSPTGAVYARWVGSTDADRVVAYLVERPDGRYNLRIAGPGGVKAPANSSRLFYQSQGAPWAETFDLEKLDTSDVVNMQEMFTGPTYSGATRSRITSIKCSTWETGNVTNMNAMFQGSTNLADLDVSRWDTSKVTNMGSLFRFCSNLPALNLTNWDVSSVTNMSYMFAECGKLASLDIFPRGTSLVTTMSYMFQGCSSLPALNVSDWDTGNVTRTSYMFDYCRSLASLDVSKWNTAKLTDASYMFSNCILLNTVDVSQWDVSSLAGASWMFRLCRSLKVIDVTDWETKSLTNTYGMFAESAVERLDLSGWDCSNIGWVGQMFEGCASLSQLDAPGLVTSKVNSLYRMFWNDKALTKLDLSSWDVSSVTNMERLVSGCSNLADLNIQGWRTPALRDMYCAFSGIAVPSLDVSTWDTSNVTAMAEAFSSCPNLTSINLGNNFSMAKVSNFYRTFAFSPKLATITGRVALSTDPSQPTTFSGSELLRGTAITDWSLMAAPAGTTYYVSSSSLAGMFSESLSLQTVDLSGWYLPNLTSINSMFYRCEALKNINLSWKGRGLELAASANLNGAFTGVPDTATLEIGTDSEARPSMNMVARMFLADGARSVTAGGRPYTPPAAVSLGDSAADGGAAAAAAAPQSDDAAAADDAAEIAAAAAAEAEARATAEAAEAAAAAAKAAAEAAEADASAAGAADSAATGAWIGEDRVVDAFGANGTSSAAAGSGASVSTASFSAAAAPMTVTAYASGQDASTPYAAGNTVARGVEGTDWVWSPAGSTTLRRHMTATPFGTMFRYRLKVGFQGDVGARSGRISFSLPLPDYVSVLDPTNPEHAAWLKGTEVVQITSILTDGTSGGLRGGHVTEWPTISPDGSTVTGSLEGLYAGNYVEVTVACVLESKPFNDYTFTDTEGNRFDYAYWDAAGAVSTTGNSASSNVYRLWDSDPKGPAPDDPRRTVTYVLVGEVPLGVSAPSQVLLNPGESIPVPTEGTIPPFGWYVFKGWTLDGAKLVPDTPMPDSDVVIVGTWERTPGVPFVQVRYAFDGDAPEGAEALLPASQEVTAGSNVAVATVAAPPSLRFTFDGYWTPTLLVNDTEVSLTREGTGASAVWKGEYTPMDGGDPVSVAIPASGELSTMQFSAAFQDAGDTVRGSVVLTYTGSWTPWRGTVVFDANSGSGDAPTAMANVTWDDTRPLPGAGNLVPPEGYTFAGWALTPAGPVVKCEGDAASGLVEFAGAQVTLYAKWVRADGYDVLWNLEHVEASATPGSATYGDRVESTLTAASGYFLEEVTVTVAGMDVTRSAWDAATGTVSFVVTGDVEVSARAVRGLNVSYVYEGDVPADAAALPTGDLLRWDGSHQVADTPSSSGTHRFAGWQPSLWVDGELWTLADDGSWEVPTGARAVTGGLVPSSGVLDASQFEGLLRDARAVEVRYTGSWSRVPEDGRLPTVDNGNGSSGSNGGASTPDNSSSVVSSLKRLVPTGDGLGILVAVLVGSMVLAAAAALAVSRVRRRL